MLYINYQYKWYPIDACFYLIVKLIYATRSIYVCPSSEFSRSYRRETSREDCVVVHRLPLYSVAPCDWKRSLNLLQANDDIAKYIYIVDLYDVSADRTHSSRVRRRCTELMPSTYSYGHIAIQPYQRVLARHGLNKHRARQVAASSRIRLRGRR